MQADRQRLKQVLLNLASNAVNYNHHGGSIRLDCHAPAEHRVAIVVADTGPGIPADKLQRLFMPFDRLGAEQTDVQGTGLGLALSKGLVEAMGSSTRSWRSPPVTGEPATAHREPAGPSRCTTVGPDHRARGGALR